MRVDRTAVYCTLLVLTLAILPRVEAGEVLSSVKAREMLRCGVSENIPGFSERDPDGRWRGLEADFCRAVAAAVLSDPEKVEFIPLRASARFPALRSRRIDLLLGSTSWTLTREAVLKVQFPGILLQKAGPSIHGSSTRLLRPRRPSSPVVVVPLPPMRPNWRPCGYMRPGVHKRSRSCPNSSPENPSAQSFGAAIRSGPR